MKLVLLAHPVLRPYLSQLHAQISPETEIRYLKTDPAHRQARLQSQAEQFDDCDALVILDGAECLPEDGLTATGCTLVVPRVHTVAALLLGEDAGYRALHERYDGGICWMLPGRHEEMFFSAPEDCHCLCYLADTQLMLPDGELYARQAAQHAGRDFFIQPSDLALLEALIAGDWNRADVAVAQPGETVQPSFDRTVLSVVSF